MIGRDFYFPWEYSHALTRTSNAVGALLEIPVVIDPEMSPGTVELRGRFNRVRIINIAEEP